MRFAVLAAAVVLLAGCGAGPHEAGTAQSFDQHLQRDGLVLYRVSAVLQPSKPISRWAAELRAARPRLHAATLDLAAAKAPVDAREDTKAILAGFRFTDRLIARLAQDSRRRDRAAILRDASALQPARSESVFRPFRAAVRDLRRKGYAVGALGR